MQSRKSTTVNIQWNVYTKASDGNNDNYMTIIHASQQNKKMHNALHTSKNPSKWCIIDNWSDKTCLNRTWFTPRLNF